MLFRRRPIIVFSAAYDLRLFGGVQLFFFRQHYIISFAAAYSYFFRRRTNFQKGPGRRDRLRPKSDEIGATLAIFQLFEVLLFSTMSDKRTRKIHMPLFGKFSRSSRDSESDYDSHKSRDNRLDSPKIGVWILFVLFMEFN